MIRLHSPLIVLSALMVGGCVSLLPDPGPSPTLMVLEGASAPMSAPQPKGTKGVGQGLPFLSCPVTKGDPWTIKVSKPVAPPHLMGRNVGVHFWQGGLLKADVLEQFQWESPLPSLFQGYFVRFLDQSGAFDGVGTDTESFDGSVGLQATIYDWYVMLDDAHKPTHVHGALGLKWMCTKNGQILRRGMVDRTVPVVSPDGAGIQRAFHQILRDLDDLLRGGAFDHLSDRCGST